MKNLLALSFSIAILFVIGCAGGASSGSVNLVTEASTEIIDLEPVWWLNPEEREGYVVGKAEGVSRDKSGARMKAQNMLINDFRQRTKSIAEGRSENFFKETGEDLDSEIMQSFSSIQNSVWNGAVENWVEFKSTTIIEKSTDDQGKPRNLYRHYVVAGIDQGAADKKLLAALKREKELMTAFEATKAYDKLQADLEKYKDKLD